MLEQMLKVEGVNINDANDQGTTPLMAAIKYGSKIDMIKLLLKAGADPNRR